MFNQKGEVSYGLDYADARSHFISDADFPQWLEQARKQGDVSLVLQLSRGESIEQQNLPPADKVQVMNRLALFWYQQQP